MYIKRIIAMILVLAVMPSMFLFSCVTDTEKNNDNGDNTDNSENNSDAEETTGTTVENTSEAPTEPEPPFEFIYDFSQKTTTLPTPTAQKLPSTWRGFNLLNMFMKGNDDRPFDEEEFKMMADWGFNFVRVPMDYRLWIIDNDWNKINESVLKRVDKAVEYGIKYDIHICLNFHRAPGYTVASPAETTDLWTQAEPQEAFASMWAEFARRYKNVPNEYLSFNLVNEPGNMEEDLYVAVVEKTANAIWEQDPDRLIIADAINWCLTPSYKIKDIGIAQATRGYYPNTLSHYRAEWMEGSEDYLLPAWPIVLIPKFLTAKGKTDVPHGVYNIEHDFDESYNLDINVGIVSNEAKLIVKADGNEIYNKMFKSGKGEGEWTEEVYVEAWDVYQNIYDKDYRVEIPAGTKLLAIEVTDGDWMTVNDMKFTPVSDGNGKTFSLTPTTPDWGLEIPAVKIDADGVVIMEGDDVHDGEWLKETYFKQWEDLINSGGGAIVGEWGSYNKTPHDVTLRWMKDNLENFKDIGIGWALWNFNASFGIINSGREDVEYEDFNGYDLDREMLDLLLEYMD